MHHPHLPLSTRDSLSEDDRLSSQNSENQKFLTNNNSRNSSTRSNTFEIGITNINNIQSSINPNPLNSKKNIHNKQMNNTNNHINGKTNQNTNQNTNKLLSPIAQAKKPTKQNKTRNGYNNNNEFDNENKETNEHKSIQTSTKQPYLSTQNTISSEQVDDLSDLPNKQIHQFNKKMRVESSSTLTTGSPSLRSNEFKYNKSVDSSNIIKPSEYKKRSKDKVLSESNTRENTPNNNNENDNDVVEIIKYSKSKPSIRLEHIDDTADIPIDNIDNNEHKYEPHTHTKYNNKNDKDKKKDKPKNKCWKCCKWYRSCVNRYSECADNSICCKKFKDLQKLGRKYITTSKWFKVIILLAILGNCAFIALEEPTKPVDTPRNTMVKKAENVFAAIFTVEMIIKMFSNGLFGYHMDDNSESSIEKERNQNKLAENTNKNNNNREISRDQINEIDNNKRRASFNDLEVDDQKHDPKQLVELADFGHHIAVTIDANAQSIDENNKNRLKRTKTPSISSDEYSEISYESTVKSETVSTQQKQNDTDPDKYVGYFRDNWNILDFIIVVTSWIEWLPIDAGSNFTAIRVLRVLRPLRTFTKVKALKVLVATIIKSLRGLSDVLVLLLFLFVVFAIIGIQMFSGVLHQQCFSNDFRGVPQSEWFYNETRFIEDENFCQIPKNSEYNADINYNGCPVELPYCLRIAPNPNGGVTNFDNIGYAILNVFVTISLEGWAAIQYKLEDTGKSLAWLYFIPLTFIVGFFAANLCLAVIESVYGEEMEKKHKKEKREGDDPIAKQAEDETNRAWRQQKQAKIIIMQSPIDKSDNNNNKLRLDDVSEDIDIVSLNDKNLNLPTDIGADDSFIKTESFRLPYHLHGEENEFRTRIVMELTSPHKKSNLKKAKTIDGGGIGVGGHRHYRSQSALNSPKKSGNNNKGRDIMSSDAIVDDEFTPNTIMSSHQAGLIQTSQEWNDLQVHNMNVENLKKKKEKQKQKHKLNHHKQTSSFKLSSKKNKKVAFQQGLGLGTQSYMHRYRTGDLPRNDTISKNEVRDSLKNRNNNNNNRHSDILQPTISFSQRGLFDDDPKNSIKNRKLKDTKHKYKHKKKKSITNKMNNNNNGGNIIDTGFMSENDALDEEDTDLDISTDEDVDESINPPKKNNNLTVISRVEDRRNKWIASNKNNKLKAKTFANRSAQSLTRPSLNTNTGRRDVLQKIDYSKGINGSGPTENFATSLMRVKTFVGTHKQKELVKDEEKYHAAHNSGSFDFSNFDSRGRVDDLTWADMPIQSVHSIGQPATTDHKGKQLELSHEIRRRQHKAKKKRKSNEILARRAILIANKRPSYMDWVEDRDQLWITKINGFVVSGIFQTFIMLIIIANTVILALTWPEQNIELKQTLETVNTVFTFIFILEAILKLIGLGPKSYFSDNWNKFDFIIVFVSIIELIIGLVSGSGASGGSAISALRSMRLLRAFRLLGKFDSLKQLFMLVVASMHEVSLLTIVLGIFIFMFAALAMSLFGGKLIVLGDSRSGRWRFDNFYWSWINVFMVISGDSWNEVMYDTVKATNSQISVIYYVIVVCFGTFVILNLFVAILLSKMGSNESVEDFMLDGLEKYSKQMFQHDVSEEDQVDRLVMSIERKKYIAQFKDKRSKWKHHRNKIRIEGKSLGIFEPDNKFRIYCHRIVHWTWFELSIDILILINCIFLALESPSERRRNSKMFQIADIFFTVIFVLEFIIKVIALGAFQQPFRKRRTWKKLKDDDKLIEWTDRSYQAVFFMHKLNPSGILDIPGLAIECIKSNDGFTIVHVWGQQVLRIVFHDGSWLTGYKLIDQDEGKWEIFEKKLELEIDKLLDKELQNVLTSFDLTDHYHNAYFASNWNRLDAFVVLVAVLGVGFNDVSFLRALRAFRPFRIMVRFKKIKVVLGALLRAIPGLFNTFLFCILFWFVLSILGVNWFAGLYRHCRIDDESYDYDEKYVMYNYGKEDCESHEGLIWWISVFNFDNVFQALHTLFCVATLSGWNFVMYEAIDSTEFNQPLIEDNNPEAAMYFMIVVILCSFFSLNLIVSVVVDNFNTIKAEKDGSAFQTEEQALWVNNQRLLERISLDPTFDTPKNWFRKLSFKIVENDLFDPFIMTCIILNAVSMGLEHYNQSDKWIIGLYISDILFVIIFCLEAILKIAAYGFKLYILSNWNKFDFIISIVGVIGLLTDSGLGLNVLRLFRVARLLRLLHQAKTLKMLFWTLVYSIPSLWNIGLLLFVIFFIYAVVGMHILTDYKTAIHSQVNADNFWNAVSLLYRVGTEDGWTDVYASYLEAWPTNDRYKIYIYFISFFVLGTLVLINLFIAVVLDSFEENHESFSREDKFIIIQIWRDIWSYFDPKAQRELPANDFIDILKLTPKSKEFELKNKIKGPGFHHQNPFITLYEKMKLQQQQQQLSINSSAHTRSNSRSSKLLKSFSTKHKIEKPIINNDEEEQPSITYHGSKSHITRRIAQTYNLEERKKELKLISDDNNVSHSDIIKLLLRLRLKVYLKIDLDGQLTCFGKLAKLIYDICNSMGIGNAKKSEDIIRQHTTNKSRDIGLEDLQKELALDSQFDIGDNNQWYISYDDALLAICSELIGPRLPDGFEMFQMPDSDDQQYAEYEITQLKIDEWYMIKYNCYDDWKAIKLSIETNKQYAEIVPSKHVSDKRQKELQKQTKNSLKFRVQFKNITKQIKKNNHNDNQIKEEPNQNQNQNQNENEEEKTNTENELINVLIDQYDMDDDDDDSIHSDVPNLNETGTRSSNTYTNNVEIRNTNLNVVNVSDSNNATDLSKNSTTL